MSDKIYPAILKLDNGCIVLATKLRCGIALIEYKNEYEKIYKNSYYEDFHGFESATNITNEYLTNTYGEVKSTEHAEFIIGLAKGAGFEFGSNKPGLESAKSFMIYSDSFDVYNCDPSKLSNELNRRQITIPLPPKQIQTSTPEEEFEMTQIMKNAGDNLVLGCEDSKCDEWPKVGDDVLYDGNSFPGIKGETVEVIGVCSRVYGDKVLTIDSGVKGVMAIVFGPWIKKPKTPEEELRDELYSEFKELINMDASINAFVDMITTKYNITKNPQ